MIPLRDTTPRKNYPVVNTGIIAANVGVFLIELSKGPDISRFFYLYGLVPARYFAGDIASQIPLFFQVFSFLSFMFLHGGVMHLLLNMWMLYIFGDNIEDRLGPLRYLIFYLLCGVASGAFHLLLNMSANAPIIGASGAIAGVMGAYFMLFPHAKILTFIPIFFIPYFIEVPAFLFLGVWFLLQFVNAAGTASSATGIAWWAHIGGFVCGIVLLKGIGIIPDMGLTGKVRRFTEKRKSDRLQVIRPVSRADDPDMYGAITITPFESFTGTKKVVNIPRGFQRRLYRVTVPPGTASGTILRLQGLGRRLPDGTRGDLMLKVLLRE